MDIEYAERETNNLIDRLGRMYKDLEDYLDALDTARVMIQDAINAGEEDLEARGE